MADTPAGRQVLGEADIARSLTRIAHEIIERNEGGDNVVLLGIPTRGTPLANRLGDILRELGENVGVGAIDTVPYRDDLHRHPTMTIGRTTLPDGGIDDTTVVLVDDVLFSGRTIRAALEAIADLGRPAKVQLAVLIDRGHRELPIRPDFVGKNLPTSRSEQVKVLLKEIDGEDTVNIAGGEK
ncbi:bifunctional pyr operon transcriptional regulator/uracil phosphoribosyltransferase [Bowdeniella nasicola]|uniref:Bifunctional protein PyrR n=1 Tax=Bowdeniella nasicola TaxID=208480 RepID=A0A1Q5Q3E8_9ACTO|nr:bifunctional pyr operon transcriptional regulator/uracil phosphoribosyltransferase PyrR [Bowdeniella nasicola]OKL54305.1 bifunctional pyr operon transcriptional regulator/uracil phosphoribosyltransferase [Bowdeniella nasicola]